LLYSLDHYTSNSLTSRGNAEANVANEADEADKADTTYAKADEADEAIVAD